MTGWLLPRATCAAAIIAAASFAVSPANAQSSYKLGYITDLSGPLAGSYTPTWEGFQLYMKALNDRGGVDGHKVEVVLDDDGLKADRAAAAAKKQAESDKVIGIFGLSLSSTQGPVYSEMRKVGMPVVSTFSGILDTLPPAKPYSYSTGVVFEVAGEAIGELIQKIKPKAKVVGMTFDSVGGRAAIAHNKKAVVAAGGSWGEVLFPVTTRDFTPFAQQAAGQKPDIIVGHYGSGQNLGMIPALRRSGFNGAYVVASYGVTEDTIEQAAKRAGSGDNIYYVTRYSSSDDKNPEVEKVHAAQKKYGTSKPFSSMHVTGWALGKFVEAALKKCGWPCDRTKLDKAIQTLEVDMTGLTGGPIVMTPTDHYGPSYWRLYVWDAKANAMKPESGWLKKDANGYK
jgi:branched-chain amino acid transport system substrate-binding protein